jgi:hypothetical protein
MPEYHLGKARTRAREKGHVVVHVSLKRRVFDRLCLMRDALQRDIGPDVHISVPTVIKRILYQHAALRKLAMRHYSPEPDEDGNSMLR